jgi:hypothetical protein
VFNLTNLTSTSYLVYAINTLLVLKIWNRSVEVQVTAITLITGYEFYMPDQLDRITIT